MNMALCISKIGAYSTDDLEIMVLFPSSDIIKIDLIKKIWYLGEEKKNKE